MRVCSHVYTNLHAHTNTCAHTERGARTLAFTHINLFAQQSNLCIQIIVSTQHMCTFDFCTHPISFYCPTTKIIISLYLSNAAVFSFGSSGSSFFTLHIKFHSLSLSLSLPLTFASLLFLHWLLVVNSTMAASYIVAMKRKTKVKIRV